MGRIIETGMTPAKRRHAHRRSCAEVLNLLAQRNGFDAEAQDMVAFFVHSLYGIYETIDESAHSWDEKGYWQKAEKLRARWLWARSAARELDELILEERWDEIPAQLIALFPHFEDVTVKQITRDADWWCGALRALRKRAA